MRTFLLITLCYYFSTSSSGQTFDPKSFFSDDELQRANTARDVFYLTEEEKDIFLYNNLVRMWPQKFYKMYLAYCRDKGLTDELKTDRYYRTLASDLKNRQPVGALLPDRKMHELAECWAIESGEMGIVGHDRVNCPGGYSGENCSYGLSGGFQIIMQLLIDHGIESLGHRKNMLNSGWKGLGTAIRPHSGYRVCAVQNFTGTNDVIRAEKERERIEREKAEAERQRLLGLRAEKFKGLLDQFSTTERRAADVGRNLAYLTEFEKDFYFYYNLARMYPRKFKKLIWDEGPFFDQFWEEQADLRRQSGFLRMNRLLSSNQPKPAFVPQKKYMDAGRCVVKRWKAGKNSTECLPGPGAWRLQTFYSEKAYNDIIGIFMNEKDFNDLFTKGSHIIVVENDYQWTKVFLR